MVVQCNSWGLNKTYYDFETNFEDLSLLTYSRIHKMTSFIAEFFIVTDYVYDIKQENYRCYFRHNYCLNLVFTMVTMSSREKQSEKQSAKQECGNNNDTHFILSHKNYCNLMSTYVQQRQHCLMVLRLFEGKKTHFQPITITPSTISVVCSFKLSNVVTICHIDTKCI